MDDKELAADASQCRQFCCPVATPFVNNNSVGSVMGNSNFGGSSGLNFGTNGIGSSGFRTTRSVGGTTPSDFCECLQQCCNGNGNFNPPGSGGPLDCDCAQINADLAELQIKVNDLENAVYVDIQDIINAILNQINQLNSRTNQLNTRQNQLDARLDAQQQQISALAGGGGGSGATV